MASFLAKEVEIILTVLITHIKSDVTSDLSPDQAGGTNWCNKRKLSRPSSKLTRKLLNVFYPGSASFSI